MQLSAVSKKSPFTKSIEFLRQYGSFITTLLILLFAGSGGFYQLTSGLFYCGINAAMPEILYWSIVIGCQCVMFMVMPLFKSAKKLYLFSQIIALPFLVFVLAQLADTYPRPFITIGVMLGIYCYLRFLKIRVGNLPAAKQLSSIELLTEGSIFIITTILIHSTLAFFILHTKGARLTDSYFLYIFIFSAGMAYFLVRKGCSVFRFSLSEFPPIFLLVFILLRSKLPDLAYDSLFYKATLPLMIADWRTALTGIFDHTLLGTNLLEIVNSQIRIIDPTYSPALTTAFAFIALWIIAPQVATSFSRSAVVVDSSNLARNAMMLLLISLTEPLTAAGTAYQEPFLILLIAASALAGPLGWFMIACAVSVKITTLFFIPFWLIWRAITVDREAISPIFSKLISFFHIKNIKPLDSSSKLLEGNSQRNIYLLRVAFVICLFLSVVVIGGQFYRNYVFTGRILAPSESLVSITDPNGEILKRNENNQVFDVVAQRGRLNTLSTTIIHMLTLDKLIKPDELGFHILPSSRLPVVALLLCMFLILFKSIRNDRKFALLAISYLVSFIIFLGFFSQGRHMAVASVFAVFVVCALVDRLNNLIEKNKYSSVLWTCMALGVAFFAISDQLVGSYINDGWDCHRPLFEAPVRPEYEKTGDDVEKVLAQVVQNYRTIHGTTNGVIPSILCEPQVERRSYFGAHYVYSYTSQSMLKSYLDVDSKRADRLPYSLLAICFENEQFFTDLIPQQIRAQYTKFAQVGNVTIIVSTPLLSESVAKSITNKGFTSLQFLNSKVITDDFVAKWLDGKLNDESHVDTPTGRGALQLTFDKVDCAVLLSPYSVQFSNVLISENDSLELEYAMPFSNSDGMEVELTVKTKDKTHTVKLPVFQRSGKDAPMDWKKETIQLPSEISGKGTLIITALSGSGNSSADWIAFRTLKLRRNQN